MKKTFLLFFLIFFCNFSLVYSDQKIALSQCNIFINNMIDNYELVKKHNITNFFDSEIRIAFEKIWDPLIEQEDEFNNDKISYGDTVYKRDDKKNVFHIILDLIIEKISTRK
jgi:hypothetical protein